MCLCTSCYLNIAIYKLKVLFAHVICTVVSIALSWTFRVVIYVSVFPFFISIPDRYRSVSDRIVPFPISRITEFVFPTELFRFRFRFRIKIWKRKWLGYFPDRSRPLSSLSRTSANTDKLSLLHCDYHRPPVGISTASAATANGKEITTRISTKNHEDPKVRRQFNFIGHHSKCSIYSHLSRFSSIPGWNVGTQKIKF